MNEYFPVKKSQLALYREIPLFYRSDDGEYVLYKKTGDMFDKGRINEEKFPGLFIASQDRDEAVRELQKQLNADLARKIAAKGVRSVKTVLCTIVEEALSGPIDKSLDAIPETVEILFAGSSRSPEFLETLSKMSTNSRRSIEHAVNVSSLALVYGLYNNMPEQEIKTLALASLLHDVGTSEIDRRLIESDERLSDEEFDIYKTHTARGHDIIKLNTNFEPVIARVALEHHETIDGRGYPRGVANISPESQLIGLIDSYEPLVHHEKASRPARKPFDALQLIKKEVIEGRYDKTNFKHLCACLLR